MEKKFISKQLLLIAIMLWGSCSFLSYGGLPNSLDTIGTAHKIDDSVKVSNPAYLDKAREAGIIDAKNTDHSSIVIKNPAQTTLFSAILPGAGQLYTGNYVKSGMFFGVEGILGLVTYYRYYALKEYRTASNDLLNQLMRYKNTDSVIVKTKSASTSADTSAYDTAFMSVHVRLKYNYAKIEERENSFLFQESALWLACLYYWNVLDALKNTRCFFNTNPKNPVTAGWLSAIPFLGLGQFYNGELSKAGMVFTAQVSMAFIIYNYHSMVRTCESNIRSLSTPGSPESRDPDAADLLSKWNGKHDEVFRNRNMWAWYGIVAYLYGILDAVVDAHLHDAAAKMRLEPDLQPELKKAGLTMKVDF